MVLLIEILGRRSKKQSFRMENQQRNSEAARASLQSFRSDLLNFFKHLLPTSNPESEFPSFAWIQQCLELPLSIVNGPFARLLKDIDYQPSQLQVDSLDEYLKYSLNLLELLNSITSSLSHLSQCKLSLYHAISLVEISPSMALKYLSEIHPKHPVLGENFSEESLLEGPERVCTGKEWVIDQALLIMTSVGYWAYGIVLACLSGDAKPYSQMMKSGERLLESSMKSSLDSSLSKRGIMELEEVNDAVRRLRSVIVNRNGDDDAVKELQRRVQLFDKMLQRVEERAASVFSEVLAWRNELLESLRQHQQH